MYQNLSKQKWYGLACLLASFATAIIYMRFKAISSAIFPVTLVMTALILFLPQKKEWSIFLGLAASGVLFSIITPVLNTPDEYAHLARSLHIASGEINLDNNPDNLVISEDFFSILHDYSDPPLAVDNFDTPSTDKTSDFKGLVDFRTTNAYWFLGYLPQAIGIFMGRFLGVGVGFIYYLGRIFNAIAYALLAYLAIRLSGQFKQMMLLITMLPMNLFLAASYNQEGITLGVIYVVIAYFIHLLTRKEAIGNKEILIYTTLCCLLVTLKLPYILLIGLLFCIPKERFQTTFLTPKLVICTVIVLALTGYWFTSYQQIQSISPIKDVSVANQLSFLFKEPFQAGNALLREFLLSPHRLVMLFYFGILTLPMREVLIPLFFFYTTVFLSNMGHFSLKIKTRLGSCLIALAIIAGIITVMYLTWTPVGHTHVNGIQGRYYLGTLPLLTLGATAFVSEQFKVPRLSDNFIYRVSLIILSMVLIFTIASTY